MSYFIVLPRCRGKSDFEHFRILERVWYERFGEVMDAIRRSGPRESWSLTGSLYASVLEVLGPQLVADHRL